MTKRIKNRQRHFVLSACITIALLAFVLYEGNETGQTLLLKLIGIHTNGTIIQTFPCNLGGKGAGVLAYISLVQYAAIDGKKHFLPLPCGQKEPGDVNQPIPLIYLAANPAQVELSDQVDSALLGDLVLTVLGLLAFLLIARIMLLPTFRRWHKLRA